MDMSILYNPTFWVTVSFLLFMALTLRKVSAMLTGALDSRADKIKTELDQAKELRVQAENVLADYKKKQAEYLQEAEQMLAKSKTDAQEFSARAEKELQASLDARMKQAMDRIEQEEAKAIEDVRNHVVDISLAAAHAIIKEHVNDNSADLAGTIIRDIERKIH